MIRVSNLKLPVDYNDSILKKAVARELRIDEKSIEKFSLLRRSIDARKKDNVRFIVTADVYLNSNENNVLSRSGSKNASITKPYEYKLPKHKPLNQRPVIIGFGPAGIFAGLTLARAGEEPIIIEQGADCDRRVKDVEGFIKTGSLNTRSNIQFGEGGAGTFSDGKLNTGTKDIRARHILNEFCAHGAPEEILYNAKPHIGTDKLREVIKSIREEIKSLGGEVLFNTKLTSLIINNEAVKGVEAESGGNKTVIDTDNVILAIGHSSRDTLQMLHNSNIFMEQKAFSVGARIEHLREKIDKSQYGAFAGNERLGAAYYKLNTQTSNGRGAYTFCMCPGGTVVPAASEENMVCVNGMSEFRRDAENSNSALLVSVNPNDFHSEHPLAGIEYQRNIERKAYEAGGGEYVAPVQRVENFLNNTHSKSFGDVKPSYQRGTVFAKMESILPDYVTDSMREAIVALDKKLKGFADPDALLTAAETRSSSPVRITRNSDTLQSISVKGLYPCGEGAGYAGGIISAAVDGIKCAEKVLTAV
ncbi:MAG: NAD(P)/FAD-dependent oxidoreductase [Ruminococcus sp.]|nr:NAD(P)/FAD-dependent oxidoreductase [Ruminococcus sp.]